MATDKLFTVVGVSRLDGEFKVRFANDVMRVKVLAKAGHEDINLIELEEPMTKLDAALFLQELDEFQDTEVRACIDDYIERNSEKPKKEKAPKAEKPAKAKKAAKADDEAAEDTADDVAVPSENELEDAPF